PQTTGPMEYIAPPAMSSTSAVAGNAPMSCDAAMTPTQPRAMYDATLSQRGDERQQICTSAPAAASDQTTASMLMPHGRLSTTRQNGVYVPAMSTKIIEWSMRPITVDGRSPQGTR